MKNYLFVQSLLSWIVNTVFDSSTNRFSWWFSSRFQFFFLEATFYSTSKFYRSSFVFPEDEEAKKLVFLLMKLIMKKIGNDPMSILFVTYNILHCSISSLTLSGFYSVQLRNNNRKSPIPIDEGDHFSNEMSFLHHIFQPIPSKLHC